MHDEELLSLIRAEFQAQRETLERVVNDHEPRIRALERKSDLRSLIISSITSTIVAAAAALSGCV